MEYTILKAGTAYDIECYVADAIAQGWRPQGGICVISANGLPDGYMQAMIREL